MLHQINHPGLRCSSNVKSTAIAQHTLDSRKGAQTYVKSSGTHSVIIQTDRIIIIQLPAIGTSISSLHANSNQHLCEPSPTTARLEKGREKTTAQLRRRAKHNTDRSGGGRGCYKIFEKNQAVDQQGTDAVLLGVVDQQGGGVVSLPTEERHRHGRRQHVGYTFKLFMPVLLAYSIEGGTPAGVALLQLP